MRCLIGGIAAMSLVIAGCGGSTDRSAQVASQIKREAPPQIVEAWRSQEQLAVDASVPTLTCKHSGGSQDYTCDGTANITAADPSSPGAATAPGSEAVGFTASCNSAGVCQWKVVGGY